MTVKTKTNLKAEVVASQPLASTTLHDIVDSLAHVNNAGVLQRNTGTLTHEAVWAAYGEPSGNKDITVDLSTIVPADATLIYGFLTFEDESLDTPITTFELNTGSDEASDEVSFTNPEVSDYSFTTQLGWLPLEAATQSIRVRFFLPPGKTSDFKVSVKVLRYM